MSRNIKQELECRHILWIQCSCLQNGR